MRGYIGINQVSTACVRFVREHEVFEDDLADLKNIRAKGMLLYVVAGEECCGSGDAVFQAIGSKLFESNHPYGPNARLELLDDLIGLSKSQLGIVLVINNAELLMRDNKDCFFDLIEIFLIQFHNWFSFGKPCYLCFQMKPNDSVTSLVEAKKNQRALV